VRSRAASRVAGHGGRLRRLYTILVAFGSIVWLALGVEWFRGMRGIPLLREAGRPDNLVRNPSLSVIVPTRDEERAIKESVETMLSQSYSGDLEVIIVDDRSTDGTGKILQTLKRTDPDNLEVLRVHDLPEGWLGKNHALYLGAKSARGEWLLFTDADVRFSPLCFAYAIEYATRHGLHHLTLPPEILSRGLLLRGFVAAFTLIFTVTQRPWRARVPQSREAVGVGSFNLVRRDVYERIGSHRAIAMRPDDDMKLAKLVKKHGFRQDVAYGNGLVSVEWHESLREAIRGLGKSMFPGMDYRVDAAILASTLLFITNVLPFFSIIFSRGPARLVAAPGVFLTCAMYLFHARYTKSRTTLWYAVLHPFSVCVFLYAMFNSVITTLAKDGIEWRGTHYPLAHLKRNTL
jgi:glycosyltransferase involved in cell wall biosynthesis